MHWYNDKLYGLVPRPRAWDWSPCVLLPKLPGATWIKHFRCITIGSIFARLYDKLLLDLFRPWLSHFTTNQIASRKTFQAAEGITMTRRLLEKVKFLKLDLHLLNLTLRRPLFDKVRHGVTYGVPRISLMAEAPVHLWRLNSLQLRRQWPWHFRSSSLVSSTLMSLEEFAFQVVCANMFLSMVLPQKRRSRPFGSSMWWTDPSSTFD